MDIRFVPVRLPIVLLMAAWLVGLSYGAARADAGPGGTIPLTDPAGAPVLQNPGFECKVGYVTQDGIQKRVPLGWTGVFLFGTPEFDSTRTRWTDQEAAMAQLTPKSSKARIACCSAPKISRHRRNPANHSTLRCTNGSP